MAAFPPQSPYSEFLQRLRSIEVRPYLSRLRRNLPAVARLRRNLPAVTIALGVLILAYVAIQYLTMYAEQRRLARQFEHQEQQIAATGHHVASDGLTRLSIPKINLAAVVVEGTSHHALLLGPGHIKDTPAPGETGNSVITGHRDTFFRHIYELNKGDTVTVQRNGETYTYEVTSKQIVKPTDVSVLEASHDARLTLITCYPTYYIGPAPERLVVFTKLANHTQLTSDEPKLPTPVSARQ